MLCAGLRPPPPGLRNLPKRICNLRKCPRYVDNEFWALRKYPPARGLRALQWFKSLLQSSRFSPATAMKARLPPPRSAPAVPYFARLYFLLAL